MNRRLVPSFVLAVHNFGADPQASIELLGYRPATVTTSAPVVTDDSNGGWPHGAAPDAVAPVIPPLVAAHPVTVFDDDGINL